MSWTQNHKWQPRVSWLCLVHPTFYESMCFGCKEQPWFTFWPGFWKFGFIWFMVKILITFDYICTSLHKSQTEQGNKIIHMGGKNLVGWLFMTFSCSASAGMCSRTFRNTNAKKKGIKAKLHLSLSKMEQRHFCVTCMYTIVLHPLSRWWTTLSSDLLYTEYTTCFHYWGEAFWRRNSFPMTT